MTKQRFYSSCPSTRTEFVKKYNSDRIFKNYAQVFGFNVIGENVIFPNGKVANTSVR